MPVARAPTQVSRASESSSRSTETRLPDVLGRRVVVLMEQEELGRVVLGVVPRALGDPAQHALLLGVHEVLVGAVARELVGEREGELEGLGFVGEADGVELLVPPPAPVVLEVEPAEVEVQTRAEQVLAVEPHLAALQ